MLKLLNIDYKSLKFDIFLDVSWRCLKLNNLNDKIFLKFIINVALKVYLVYNLFKKDL